MIKNDIKIGDTITISHTVTEEQTAVVVGSGDVNVLATPIMIAFMEGACAKLLQKFLLDDASSVGTSISTTHLSPTRVGMEVTITATITVVENRAVTFEVTANDEVDLIGKATHSRFIIDREKFNQKAQTKGM